VDVEELSPVTPPVAPIVSAAAPSPSSSESGKRKRETKDPGSILEILDVDDD